MTNDEREAQATAFHEANSNCFTEFESFDSGWKAGAEYARRTVSGQEAVGVVGTMPGTEGFTMACFEADHVPVGTKLYAAPIPATEPK